MLTISLAVEDHDVDKLRTIAQEAIGLMRGHCFGWKAFWHSNPEWSCVKLNFEIYLPYLGRVKVVPYLFVL
jgi:hypothetical protein